MLNDVVSLRIPPRIQRLEELAYNLWWSWHPRARELFRMLDYSFWKSSGHNPVKVIREISPEKLQEAAVDPAFLTLFDSVLAEFDADLTARDSWFQQRYPGGTQSPVAYFSSEFAIHSSLPIYAGGLGVLAGDICKEASDTGIPMVGVGLMYPKGYFQQHISPDGWQEEIYRRVDFNEVPVTPVLSPGGQTVLANVKLDGHPVDIGAWRVRVGKTNLILLHTDLDSNPADYRRLADNLYVSNQEQRLQQEVILGIGGVRVLRTLGIRPIIWHANEGHTAFMMLERISEKVGRGMPLAEAARCVRSNTVFTTHTPVPAGHDMFPVHMIDKYLLKFWEPLGLSRQSLLDLGCQNGSFNMTVLALATAGRSNAVSKLNGTVTRKMWQVLWPDRAEEQVPIWHVTNGIHVPTWIAPEMGQLYEKYIGPDWVKQHDDVKIWDNLKNIPDAELWAVRQELKLKLQREMRERLQRSWSRSVTAPQQMAAMGVMLDPEALTIGFVRRFTEYKRPFLLFQDLERLKRILNDSRRPVQLVFAGKSHPNDFPAKCILQQTYAVARDPAFQGRVAFIEDYDMHLAQYLVPGVDVWLNTPRRCREACGTSGIKASLNGAVHLSILDGWWHEGYNGDNGWAIGSGCEVAGSCDEDPNDSRALYELLEEDIAPLYYERGKDNIPHAWLGVIREAIHSVAPAFSARRMMKEYVGQLYEATPLLSQRATVK